MPWLLIITIIASFALLVSVVAVLYLTFADLRDQPSEPPQADPPQRESQQPDLE